jgi:5-methylcytosine-specific restriction endonuclease McrA
MRTLVLDQGYQPHRIVTWQKAVTMLFGGKVEVVEEYDEEIRSVSLTIRMPAVVRLVRRLGGRARAIRFSRFNVMVRDGFACQYCGQKLPAKKLTMDHVLPRSRGGKTSWTNVVSACGPCNHRKGAHTPAEARMKVLTKPVKPKWLPMEAWHVRLTDVPETWESWLYWNSSLGK